MFLSACLVLSKSWFSSYTIKILILYLKLATLLTDNFIVNFFITGTVRFELTTLIRSTYFQDKGHKPDSAKYPLIITDLGV